MKLPRDVSGKTLLKSLEKFGYRQSRQVGSHVRTSTNLNGQHHITIPMHDELRVGTLNAIVTDIATHLGLSKQEIIARLFY